MKKLLILYFLFSDRVIMYIQFLSCATPTIKFLGLIGIWEEIVDKTYNHLGFN